MGNNRIGMDKPMPEWAGKLVTAPLDTYFIPECAYSVDSPAPAPTTKESEQ